jgi:phage terminase Nu1 subunit (DNA packaging protein)
MAREANLTADTTQMARFIDMTPRHVRRLQAEGILTLARDENGHEVRGRYELYANNIAYIRYLRRKTQQLDDTSEAEYTMLRNRRTAADAERSELELKLYKGQLHRSEDINFVLTNMLTSAKARLLAIPSRVTRLIVGVTEFQRIYDLIYKEIEATLKELSDFNRRMFAAKNRAYLRGGQSANGGGSRRE